ncbi:MAG: aliphatic sulfonate ABC transporter substrate-binding protein [Microcoleus sp. PH2017_10_PVI_O_A]|uniref:aliphatic sulfonate ABC transporter substrate-binding protein n=1 Tax=unclassified Microcoleus TaxID=2642155 RepID=UPI001D48394D|nr:MULTISPECIES: aliphatic sulfonate ABC transporter substrate-binding protein [unclassified Microcoleus]TAE81163.1 MAG: aliphatic sulfonate ABC transporter substrate-binding protein [Oscillatoriales cyanobacterium]MCC3407240.1 aliphatic sulfonate ABC transporter substrate-binding protein [Microcoleus sp. PH2017_10_PVI_O_A]MCC3461323.1 aliphatic sulfonate ABC transporter substrate-binding protein [Microcoleus sp. PH2017_11_PCY_U_A]MCC3479771.1 aliphatic sulfonate ABC transporter substrate-bindi
MSHKKPRFQLSFFSQNIRRRLAWGYSLLLILFFCLSLTVASCNSELINSFTAKKQNSSSNLTKIVRIGHQPFGALLYLKAKGSLETRLAKMGWSVEWTEFVAGPPILKAIGQGKIDLGYAGVAPPIFAQSEGVPFVYIANDSALPGSIGIIVPENSPMRTLADLKGKKIAATRKTSAHYLLIRALTQGGLQLKDVELVDLLPPKAQEAFLRGEVDAWAVWQPFLAKLQEIVPAHFLTESEGLINDRNFYLASRSFASDFPDIVKTVMGETRQMANWITKNPERAVEFISARTGMKKTTARSLTKSRTYDLLPIQDRAVEEQQRIAEIFFRLGLLPDRIWIEDRIWKQKLDL